MLFFNTPFIPKIAIIGLGYVGLPLAVSLSRNFDVTGFDINETRLKELKNQNDSTHEISKEDLAKSSVHFTSTPSHLKDRNIFIITVPTPVDTHNQPDLTPLLIASKLVGKYLTPQNIVVYESTVYPGVTEEICGALLASISGLTLGKDFYLGYSPERINPGDKEHSLATLTKVVASQTPEVTKLLVSLYGTLNQGNIYTAKSIKVAEAAKVIENTQRDINIAFVNEVTQIFNKLDLSIYDVLDAARTKWNFLPFMPGLVGGHCIGVDPFYLAKCALDLGYHPDITLAGRYINDAMSQYVTDKILQFLPPKSKILILGITFKENVSDVRNSKVIDIKKSLENYGHHVSVHDPVAHLHKAKEEYNIDLLVDPQKNEPYDLLFLAVPHDAFLQPQIKYWTKLLKKEGYIFDLKGIWRNQDFPKPLHYHTL